MKDRMIKKQSMNTIAILSSSIAMVSAFALIGLSFYAMLDPANATIVIQRYNLSIYGMVFVMMFGFIISAIRYG